MIPRLYDYQRIVGREMLDKIRESAAPLEGKHITHINSTSSGGGVAEILNSLVLLKNQLKLQTGWRLLKGTHSFFTITKRMHNALQGENTSLGKQAYRIYMEETERNAIMNHLQKHDMVVVHDPQPLAMIQFYKTKWQPWVWRCHIDITHANSSVWWYVSRFIRKYNAAIFSMKRYRKRNLKIPSHIIYPSIDPLSLKNKKLPHNICRRMLANNGIDLDKPIVCQVSRFDKWKNPLGVIQIFEQVKRKVDCQLVMIGDMAMDDPEGPLIYSKLVRAAEGKDDIHLITKRADTLVNALQTMSDVIIQNSRREGFGLVVTEAMWKGTPVVGANVGGIPLQIVHGRNGYLYRSRREAAKYCMNIIKDDKLREKLGKNAKERVRKKFLITRHLQDYLDLYNLYLNE